LKLCASLPEDSINLGLWLVQQELLLWTYVPEHGELLEYILRLLENEELLRVHSWAHNNLQV